MMALRNSQCLSAPGPLKYHAAPTSAFPLAAPILLLWTMQQWKLCK